MSAAKELTRDEMLAVALEIKKLEVEHSKDRDIYTEICKRLEDRNSRMDCLKKSLADQYREGRKPISRRGVVTLSWGHSCSTELLVLAENLPSRFLLKKPDLKALARAIKANDPEAVRLAHRVWKPHPVIKLEKSRN